MFYILIMARVICSLILWFSAVFTLDSLVVKELDTIRSISLCIVSFVWATVVTEHLFPLSLTKGTS